MTKETRLKIINLAKFVFEDEEYDNVMFYLKRNRLNDLRLFIDEKCDFLEITAKFSNEEVDLKRSQYCQELESLVLDVVIEATG